jgi:hypothetical protein
MKPHAPRDGRRSVAVAPAIETESAFAPLLDALHPPKRRKKCEGIQVEQGADQASRYLTASPDWKFARELWWTKRRLRIEAHAVRVQQMLRRIESRCRQHPGRGCRRAVWCIDLRRRFASLSEAARFVGRSPNSIIRAALSGGRCAGLQWEFCASRNKKVNAKTP